MADLKLAAQDAVFDKLTAATALTTLLGGANRIWQHPPDELDPPYVIIADMSASPIGGKDGGFDRIEFDIVSVIAKPGREHLTPIQAAVRAALEAQALTPPAGVELTRPEFEGDEDQILDDGITYVGTQRFSLVAQPAD